MTGHGSNEGKPWAVLKRFNIDVVKHQIPCTTSGVTNKINPRHSSIYGIQNFLPMFPFTITTRCLVEYYRFTRCRFWNNEFVDQTSCLLAKLILFEEIKTSAYKEKLLFPLCRGRCLKGDNFCHCRLGFLDVLDWDAANVDIWQNIVTTIKTAKPAITGWITVCRHKFCWFCQTVVVLGIPTRITQKQNELRSWFWPMISNVF